MKEATITDWMEALVSATHELAATSLGYDEGTAISTAPTLTAGSAGSCIALIGEEASLQIGIAAAGDNVMILARALFGMPPDEDDLGPEDVIDAMAEIANVVAGGVKVRMADQVGTMSLGLPIVLHGPIDVSRRVEVAVTEIRWAAAEAHIIIMRQIGGM